MRVRKLGIIADDLTGAMDSSGYFANLGFTTVVVLDQSFSVDAAVLVITTNSRAETPVIARLRVSHGMKYMADRIVYKKVDSTLRGNIGEELLAVTESTASQKVVVAPAFPSLGRTMVDGILLVEGIPVAQTQFASDPVSPVKESNVCKLLEQSMRVKIGHVSLAEIEARPETLKDTINNKPEDVVVCDVLEQSHLTSIAQAATLVEGRWLLCGSGGLARELRLFLADAAKMEKKQAGKKVIGPVLLIVGTRNQVAANQLVKANDMLGIPILKLEVEKLNFRNGQPNRLRNLLAKSDDLISEGKGLAVSSTFSEYMPNLTHKLAGIMAEIAAIILASHKFAGIFLSGGDIAIHACQQLCVSAIEVRGEIEPGLPAGELIGGQYDGMRVVTKAGGFGTEEAIVKSIEYLERGTLT